MESKIFQLTLIFPMAGKGARFGYRFKPFLRIGGQTFIERAMESFAESRAHIKEVVFIFLKKQEDEFRVSHTLKKMFPALRFRVIILDDPTKSHAETARRGIMQGEISGPVMVCDCDHYLDTRPMFRYLRNSRNDSCVVPLWKIGREEVQAWAVASVSPNMRILSIAEKKFPQKRQGEYYGIIGCYYFRDPRYLLDEIRVSLSESVEALIEKKERITGVRIDSAEFFGDPQRLQQSLEERLMKYGGCRGSKSSLSE